MVLLAVDIKLKSCSFTGLFVFSLQLLAANEAFMISQFFTDTTYLQSRCFFTIKLLLETTPSYFEIKHLLFISESSIDVYWPRAS